jgi:type I restriction enzyme S subunit
MSARVPRWPGVRLDRLVRAERTHCRPENIPAGAFYVGLEHVVSEVGVHREVPAAEAGLRSSKYRFERGDVLFGKLRPNLRKVAVARCDGVCSTDLLPLRPGDPASAWLLAFQLRTAEFAGAVGALTAGASLPRIAVHDLLSLEVPLPPRRERPRLYELARLMDEARDEADRLDLHLRELHRIATPLLLGATPRGG